MPAIDLKLYNELDVKSDARWHMLIADYDGYDPTTGAYMRSSNGRRKPGRPKKYFACYLSITYRFTAHSDEEARDKANKMLNYEYEVRRQIT